MLNEQFVRIFNLYKNDVYRLAYSYSKNFFDSDDITQNVFIKLYKHYEILEQPDINIKKWLVRVTINESKTTIISFWKRKITDLADTDVNSLYEEIKNNDVLEAILKLPKKYRTIVFLYYYENYKIKEIAELLHISVTNIQTILSRAREKLKDLLKEA